MTKVEFANLSPYEQGYHSYLYGDSETDIPTSNPYAWQNKAYSEWENGFRDAEIEVGDDIKY